VGWTRRYVLFHGRRHPRDLDGEAVAAFLTHLATERDVAVSTQRQASSALLFLYAEVLGSRIDLPAGVARPRKQRRLPIVLSRGEVPAVLDQVRGRASLPAHLLYGAGLRLMEALTIRVKDLSFERGEITIRGGKGGHDRIAILPRALSDRLRKQVSDVRRIHVADLKAGAGWVALPGALARKIPSARRDPAWQFLFPGQPAAHGSGNWRAAPAPPARKRDPARGHGRSPPRAHRQARHVSHAPPLIRHPSARGRLRHPNDPGASRPQEREDHDDLHARPEPRRRRRDQPARPAVLSGPRDLLNRVASHARDMAPPAAEPSAANPHERATPAAIPSAVS